MNNLFPFEYVEQTLNNQDGSESNFRQVFGLDGKNVACPKKSYHIIKTADVSTLGQAFVDKGYNVKTFNHRNGETIGLNVSFGNKPAKVGESQYNLIITVPNNGGGKGYLAIKQVRLICTNGMVSNKTMHKDNYIKIPHTVNYNESIVMMQKSIEGFTSLLEQVEQRDAFLDGQSLTDSQVRFELNKWFFENEMPKGHKEIQTEDGIQKMTLNQFREIVFNEVAFKSAPRYNELMEAFKKEVAFNKELGLDLSMYTVYASVTNYLSRRVEKSNSKASNEVQVERASLKLAYFDAN